MLGSDLITVQKFTITYFIIELQIKATVGGENNYCIRKTVIITQLITMVIQLLQHCKIKHSWCGI